MSYQISEKELILWIRDYQFRLTRNERIIKEFEKMIEDLQKDIETDRKMLAKVQKMLRERKD